MTAVAQIPCGNTDTEGPSDPFGPEILTRTGSFSTLKFVCDLHSHDGRSPPLRECLCILEPVCQSDDYDRIEYRHFSCTYPSKVTSNHYPNHYFLSLTSSFNLYGLAETQPTLTEMRLFLDRVAVPIRVAVYDWVARARGAFVR